jgi:formyl-CoA transferase
MSALDGMRILDMTQYEAGTSCTQMLAWLGADVVKIESPHGDPGRRTLNQGAADSQYFLNYNSNKRSLAIDLSSQEGRDLFLRLVPRFNVFVENFGPGVVEKLGIPYEVLSGLNPKLIYARIKGFGLSGPYAGYRVFDPLAQAAAGTFSVTGESGGPPTQPGPTLADTGTGMQMALAIAAAYVQLLNTGAGQQIEVSMQEASLMFMKTRPIAEWSGERAMPRRSALQSAPSGIFPCAPGGLNDYVYLSIVTSQMWDKLCLAIDKPGLINDDRFQTPQARAENSGELRSEITEWTRKRSKFDAMQTLCEAGVPASAVFDSVDVFHDPHLAERGVFKTVDHPVAGAVKLMTNPLRMSGSKTDLVVAPLLGEHSGDVLQAELGLGEDEIRQLESRGVIVNHGRGDGSV